MWYLDIPIFVQNPAEAYKEGPKGLQHRADFYFGLLESRGERLYSEWLKSNMPRRPQRDAVHGAVVHRLAKSHFSVD